MLQQVMTNPGRIISERFRFGGKGNQVLVKIMNIGILWIRYSCFIKENIRLQNIR